MDREIGHLYDYLIRNGIKLTEAAFLNGRSRNSGGNVIRESVSVSGIGHPSVDGVGGVFAEWNGAAVARFESGKDVDDDLWPNL